METDTEQSIWNKKQTDMTVGDSLKIGVGVTVIATVAPLVILGVASGVSHLVHKIRTRKLVKEAESIKDKK
jgi:hypothetical protein